MLKKAKKRLILIGIVLAIFLPTYLALTSYFVINSIPEPINTDGYDIHINEPSGNEMNIDGADKKMITAVFLEMIRDSKRTDSAKTEGGLVYNVVISSDSGTDTYKFRLFADGEGYMFKDNIGASLQREDVGRFLSTKYAGEMFENSSLPLLKSSAGRYIYPVSAEWKYLAYNGAYADAGIEKRKEGLLYERYTAKMELDFEVEPTECSVTVKDSGGTLFSGDLSQYRDLAITTNTRLEYEINASWSGDTYSGSALYRFYSVVGELVHFEISSSCGVWSYGGKEYIEFVEVNGANIESPSDVKMTVTPSLGVGVEPKFFSDGFYVRAIVPLGNSAKEGTYTLTLTYGDTVEVLTFDFSRRRVDASRNNYPAEALDTVNRNYSIYRTLMAQVCGENADVVYMRGEFLDPEELYGSSSLIVGFGRDRYVDGTTMKFNTQGVEYATESAIVALNNGKVVAVGEDAWIGKYVVIDHGLGLKTWYCHLSEVRDGITVGNTVAKNEMLGMPGDTGYANKGSRFLLITTANGVPISPYSLFENGVEVSGNS